MTNASMHESSCTLPDSGFSAANDLYHRFSERYGLSPTEYRRKLLNG